MEIVLQITGWIHYVGLAALVAFAGSVVISTVVELWQGHLREDDLAGSASLHGPVRNGAL